MKFEMIVEIAGTTSSVVLKKEEELDFIPTCDWTFKYGEIELVGCALTGLRSGGEKEDRFACYI